MPSPCTLCLLQHDPELRPTICEVLQSPQLESRVNLLPAGLEKSLSQHNLSLGCMEVWHTSVARGNNVRAQSCGLSFAAKHCIGQGDVHPSVCAQRALLIWPLQGSVVLPAIDIPEDLQDLNKRLPPPRYSSDNLGPARLELAAQFAAPAVVPPCPPSGAAQDSRPAPAGPAAAADDGLLVLAEAAGPAAAAATRVGTGAQPGRPPQSEPALPANPASLPRGSDAGQAQQQQQRGAPPHSSLTRIASLATVLELCSMASGSVATPVAGPGTGGSGSTADGCGCEALDQERAGIAVHAASRKQGVAAPPWGGYARPVIAPSPFTEQRARFAS